MTIGRVCSALLAGATLVTAVVGWAHPASAQSRWRDAGNETSSPAMIRVDLSGGGASQSLALPMGKSALVQLPIDARDVMVTNPGVADVVLRSPRRISVLGIKQGTTDASFFDAQGRRILSLNIHVDIDPTAVGEMIDRLLPGADVHAEGLNGSIILSGQVATASDADKAVQIARTGVAKPEMVVDMLNIAGKDQVMLKVRIVEVERSIIKQLGLNLSAVIGRLGQTQFTLANPATYAINGSILGGVSGGYQLNTTQGGLVPGSNGLNQAAATIQAFERVGLVRTLAEPNLTAISGESAKFLAGGEFPVPTGQDNTGRVTIDFKPFGVGLGFTPVVLSGGRISLKISTEVSELSNTGAFSLSNGPGAPTLVVPSLTVRRAETTVELPSGGAMMIAGLLQDTSKQDIDAVPGVKDLPVLGALFRSRDYQAGESELVVIVTPYIVTAASPQDMQTPADGLRIATDKDTVLLGRLNRSYNRPPAATAGRTYQAPIGYVVE
ncbi:MAG TPA: type II and III secretion system protein family protein [Caulobacteraceae bacterium]